MKIIAGKLKHIHRQFRNQVNFKPKPGEKTLPESLSEIEFPPHNITPANMPEGFQPLFIADEYVCSGMRLTVDRDVRIIPEPDVILVYYSTAYYNFNQLNAAKEKVIKYSEKVIGVQPEINEMYDYMALVSIVVIFLFTSLEATMNRAIPDDYVLTKESNNKTEIFTKVQIERTFSFERKLSLLNEITGKDFKKKSFDMNEHILALKDFRDDIIHTKSINEGDGAANHNFRKAFVFDFRSAMISVREFCNYYLNKELIVNCPCSKDT